MYTPLVLSGALLASRNMGLQEQTGGPNSFARGFGSDSGRCGWVSIFMCGESSANPAAGGFPSSTWSWDRPFRAAAVWYQRLSRRDCLLSSQGRRSGRKRGCRGRHTRIVGRLSPRRLNTKESVGSRTFGKAVSKSTWRPPPPCRLSSAALKPGIPTTKTTSATKCSGRR